MKCEACNGEGRRMDEGFYCVYCGGSGLWDDGYNGYTQDEWYEEEEDDYEDGNWIDIGGTLFNIDDGRPAGGVY